MNKYRIELTEEQAKTMIHAMDLASRILSGQLGIIDEYISSYYDTSMPYDVRRGMLNTLKMSYKFGGRVLEQNESLGISNTELVEDSRTLYDMLCVIRHSIARDKAGNPEKRNWNTMVGYYYDSPMHYGKADLIKCEKVVNSD